jgi:hypothetical protein
MKNIVRAAVAETYKDNFSHSQRSNLGRKQVAKSIVPKIAKALKETVQLFSGSSPKKNANAPSEKKSDLIEKSGSSP